MKFLNAQELIKYLYSLPVLHEKSDLTYIQKVLAILDNPQDKVKTIHVTGTNGKGSTSYYLSNLLKKAGLKTGLFVSPFIRKFNERIQINGQDIPDAALVKIANQVEVALDKIRQNEPEFSLVTFEYEVVMAFLYFHEEKCDYAVIEVGIGGTHDKTNVIKPELSIITTIGLDHEQIIGPTLLDIAKEKSGVIKTDRPVVLGNVPTEVLPVLEGKAKKENSPVYLLNHDFMIKQDDNGRINYAFGKRKLVFSARPNVEAIDIGIATTAVLLLKVKLTDQEIEQTINGTQIPGRYQVVQRRPTIILDGAHNIQAMSNLLEFIHQHHSTGKIKVLITMMKDKDLEQVFSLFDKNDEVMLTTIPYPRAAKKADFPKDVQEKYQYFSDYQAAFKKAKNSLNENDLLLVTGSFYLVSAVLNMEA
ncbi:bifunctional folylpolyglutamate synthase/dihydrofolate synthase [Lactobacillus kalixensis]|uniref:tetrahydrofolate synthase n=1 Tax=Lactobacillus kalixensis DSM 16043 TaxID=1423763 RepID=A0A0R1UJC8_9LACO|nr:folylpolyglutamate synthase/dihydrofolate synthase family protein [Lactobacillus kalixensis]KRL91363.1 folylpolyglutamate synthase [Lactobacillus kalixensis DSM 16043]